MKFVDLAPDVQFILDHCGVPDIRGGAFDTWSRDLAELARRPNVAGKLSGIVAYTDTDSWTLADIRPYAEHTINAFGFDCMVWGSDWPVCTLAGTLSTWVGATQALLEGVSGRKGQVVERQRQANLESGLATLICKYWVSKSGLISSSAP